MKAKKTRRALIVVYLLGLVQIASPRQIVSAQDLEKERQLSRDFVVAVGLSLQMVDNALEILSDGRSEMTPGERAVFDMIFDPANTGQIDEAYMEEMRGNMRRIRSALSSPIGVRYAPDSPHCIGERLYYTDLISVSICPYFLNEQDVVRKARGLVHEIAHRALLVADRPYFVPGSEAYANLTPRGGRIGQLPLIGRILREVIRGDTLYHPDAYAHLAAAFSGIPGELALYQRFLPELDGPEATTASRFTRSH